MTEVQNDKVFERSIPYETSADLVVETEPAPITSDQFSAVLIRKNGLLGAIYFLNYRPRKEPDGVYANRIALFAGKRKLEIHEDYEACAVREVFEETGLEITERNLVPLLRLEGWNSAGKKNVGRIYLLTYSLFDRGPSARKIREHIKNRASEENIGQLKIIRRYFWSWFWFLNWARFTPELIYALVADFDIDLNGGLLKRR